MKFSFQRILIPLFIFIWFPRLHDIDNGLPRILKCYNVVGVKGWRTALVDNPGYGRQTITFCPLWFK